MKLSPPLQLMNWMLMCSGKEVVIVLLVKMFVALISYRIFTSNLLSVSGGQDSISTSHDLVLLKWILYT